MVALELVVFLAAIVVALRARPPEAAQPPRLLSLLATVALSAWGVAAASLVLFRSTAIFVPALAVAGISGATFLWLARGGPDDDGDDGSDADDRPPPPDPDAQARWAPFRSKHLRPTRPRTPIGR